MRTTRGYLALPLALAISTVAASGSEVRDKAGLFSPEAVTKANADLRRIESETNVPVVIETIPSLNGQSIDDAVKSHGQSEGIKGLLVLIAARDHHISAGASHEYDRYFNRPRFEAIYEAFMPDFRKNAMDAGLASGVSKIESTLLAVKSEVGGAIVPAVKHAPGPVAAPVARRGPIGPAPAPAQARSGMGTLIGIVLLVLAVIVGFRILGALFGAGRGGYGGPGAGMGGPMRGPGGYGAPGYGGGGGGGGGFMSSLFGGIGGAMAGNWLYDQFSGRNHHADPSNYAPPTQDAPPAEAGGDWGTTAGDGGGDWGNSGGAGGGGGGDWGNSGGGGDWGGGGGGGDWGGGGGGGDGGSW